MSINSRKNKAYMNGSNNLLTVIIALILLIVAVAIFTEVRAYFYDNSKDEENYIALQEAYIITQVDRTIELIDLHMTTTPLEQKKVLESIVEDLLEHPDRLDGFVRDSRLEVETLLEPYRTINPYVDFAVLNSVEGVLEESSFQTSYDRVENEVEMITVKLPISSSRSIVLLITDANIEEMVKEHLIPYIRNIRLRDNGYIWVNEVLDYSGGENYAIRRIHANLQSTEGEYLSTGLEDSYGNKPYQIELDGINNQGEITFEYYFKKMDSDIISRKMSYAKLYEPFDWIVATGLHLDDIEVEIISLRQERWPVFVKQMVILLVSFLGLVIMFVIRARVSYESWQVRNENLLLADDIKRNSRVLEEVNAQLEEEISDREHVEDTLRSMNISLDKQVEKRTRMLKKSNEKLRTKVNELERAYEELSISKAENKLQDDRIRELIYVDRLTGLQNRRSITDEIRGRMEGDHTSTGQGIIFIDVDNFKYINDTYGHDIGDLVIASTGERLKRIESEDIAIGRFGGDEFMVYFSACHSKSCLEGLLNRIIGSFKEPIDIDEMRFYLTLSMGVALYPDHGLTTNEIIKKADMALYEAKGSGKDKYVFFDDSLNMNLEHKIVLQRAIREALASKSFILYYQPIVDAKDGRLTGYEALIRWHHEELGWVSPYELITTAEEMGIIVEIGDWVIREAMLFAKEINIKRLEPLRVSINISQLQLREENFKSKLIEQMKETGVRADWLCVEMTETILINSLSHRAEDLKALIELGFEVALDDFGTGYSSLSYFRELPLTILKIDKSFIDEITISRHNQHLVEVMLSIAHNRDVSVTAEGVEDQQQLEILTELGCDTIQGYYFSRPLNREDALKYLDKQDI